MPVNTTPMRTIRVAADGWRVEIIDQTQLPHHLVHVALEDVDQVADAISRMRVRGAPLIGVTAAYGMALGCHHDPSDAALRRAYDTLLQTRPTAVNLRWALDDMLAHLTQQPEGHRPQAAYTRAAQICEADVQTCAAIGRHGLELLRTARQGREGRPLQILTHCNAGWLATVEWGTALAPVYMAFDAGLPVHVWVDETRPRNQGARLTAWELAARGVPHTVIADNTGGHLMQRGQVDLCIVGTDRTTAQGDVCNKIGTYLKALAAFDNGIPFYVAAPSSSIDFSLQHGTDIPIEERSPDEVHWIRGRSRSGELTEVRLTPEASPAANYAFDVTPARLVTALITERGVCAASPEGLRELFAAEAGG